MSRFFRPKICKVRKLRSQVWAEVKTGSAVKGNEVKYQPRRGRGLKLYLGPANHKTRRRFDVVGAKRLMIPVLLYIICAEPWTTIPSTMDADGRKRGGEFLGNEKGSDSAVI